MTVEAQFDLPVDQADPQMAVPDGGGATDDDYLTVTMLSAGLIQILRRRARAAAGERSDEGLLPPAWRVAFTRLWWRCVGQGVAPIATDLDLLEWCTKPLIVWPVVLGLSETDLQNPLLVGEQLSEFAEQGARLARADVEAEWVEHRVHQALRAAAAANGTTDDEVQDAYAFLRRYLIDHAVVGDRAVRTLERRFGRKDSTGQTHLRRLVEAAYVARPATGEQVVQLCPRCRNLVTAEACDCGTAGCPGGPAEPFVVRALAVVYEQHRATRLFIHDPGLVEARIIDALRCRELADRVKVTPYPGLDTLDVLIEFFVDAGSGGRKVVETWGVDAKDQVSAHLLGRGFAWPDAPPCDRRFLALPMHRAGQPGYVADLETELDGRVAGVEVISEERLIQQVKSRAGRVAR